MPKAPLRLVNLIWSIHHPRRLLDTFPSHAARRWVSIADTQTPAASWWRDHAARAPEMPRPSWTGADARPCDTPGGNRTCGGDQAAHLPTGIRRALRQEVISSGLPAPRTAGAPTRGSGKNQAERSGSSEPMRGQIARPLILASLAVAPPGKNPEPAPEVFRAPPQIPVMAAPDPNPSRRRS